MKDAVAQRTWTTLSNLTENQLLFWMGYKLQRSIPVETHSIRFLFTVEDRIDRNHFQLAVQKLVDNADALRTVFREVDMVPQQEVSARASFIVHHVRCSDDPDAETAFRHWVNLKRQTALSCESPFESALIEVGSERFVWFLALHHLISDARTVYLIAKHVAHYYELSLDGKLDSAPPLPAFEDYVSYDLTYRSSEARRKAESYWSNKLASSRLRRPNKTSKEFGSHTGSSMEKLRTECVSRRLDMEQSEALTRLVRQEVLVSPALVFLTVLFLTLARLRGSTGPVAIGTPFLNRPERFLNTIGLFVSTCPLIVETDRQDTFLSLARRVQTEFIRASAHQNYPIQNPVHGRIYEAFFNYLNVQFPSFSGRKMLTERIRSGFSNNSFNLAVHDFDASGRFTLDFELRRQEFAPDHQQDVVVYFVQLIDAFITNPGQMVARFL